MNLKDSNLLSFVTSLGQLFWDFLPNLYRHWILATIEKSAKQTHFKYASGVKNIINLSLVLILHNHKDEKSWVIWMFNLKQHKHEISGNKQNNSSNNISLKQQDDDDLPTKQRNRPTKTKTQPQTPRFWERPVFLYFSFQNIYHKLH